MKRYQCIAVAVETGEEAPLLMESVRDFVEGTKMKVVLCSVVDMGRFEMAGSYRPNHTDQEKARRRNMLEWVRDEFLPDYAGEVSIHVGVGSPKRVLTRDVCDIFRPDLMVCMDTKSAKERRFPIGSVSRYILTYAPCDVLVVKWSTGK